MSELKNPFSSILTDLDSKNKDTLLAAIEQARSKSNAKVLIRIINLLKESPDDEIRNSATNYLLDLKDESAVEPLIEAIKSGRYKKIEPTLLSILWQSSLDASEHLISLIEIATEGNYQSCLEVLTIVENFNSEFTEEDINECIYLLNEGIESGDEDKAVLLTNLSEVIQNLPRIY